jgi:D-ornithine---citrate ligase
VRNSFFYAVFQNHLGELLRGIVRWCGIEEKELWMPVVSVTREVFSRLKQDLRIAEQAAADEEVLFAEAIYLKAMTTMRLLGEDINYTFTPVANPLAQVRSEVGE